MVGDVQHSTVSGAGITKRISMPTARGRAETHAWQQRQEGRGQKHRLKDGFLRAGVGETRSNPSEEKVLL